MSALSNALDVKFIDISNIKNPYESVKSINDSIDDWSRHTDFINRKYIQMAQTAWKAHLFFDFALQDDKIVGYSIVRPDVGDKTYLSYVAIIPEYQGKGIGSTLLDSVISRIKELNKYSALFMEVRDKNKDFYVRFAEKRGINATFEQLPPGRLCQWKITYSLT